MYEVSVSCDYVGETLGQTASAIWAYHLTAYQQIDSLVVMTTEALTVSCALLLGIAALVTGVVWYARR